MINKKGMTLVEVIISVTLVSIVTMFIYALFINVQDINDESKTTSSYLINKSLIIKTIEEDLNSASSLHVTKDGCNNVYSSIKYDSYKSNLCIKFVFDNNNSNYGYLAIYYHKEKNKYVLSYVHKYNSINIRETKILENYNKYNSTNKTNNSIPINAKLSYRMFLLNIPMIGPDYKDYSLNISYYGNVTCDICS